MYCDSSSNFELDEGVLKPNKKKKPKNPPFDGHGIGYQKGQTVVIKLPVAEEGKLPDLSAIEPVDHLRALQPQILPQEEVILYRGLQYPYTLEQTTKQHEIEKNIEDDDDNERNKDIHWESLNADPDNINNDETFAEAYEKLSQKVYGADFYPTYNTDDETKVYAPVTPNKVSHNQNEEHKSAEASDEFEDTDSTYRTRLPYKNIYSKPVLMRYIKGKQRIKEQIPRAVFSHGAGAAWSEEAQNQNSGEHSPFIGKDMEHKSSGYLPTGENDNPEAKKRKAYSSNKNYNDFTLMPYFGDSLRSAPIRNFSDNSQESFEFDESTESPRRRKVYSVFDYPSQDSWYKPVYSEQVSRPY